jgi:NAD(P)-dependent dehydrogenase (short-subunit alcohol dehydrogenase family)
MRLQGKAVLVTGAALRVGRAIALALGQRGARVAIHYNTSKAAAARVADELKDSFGRDSMTVKGDLSDPKQVRKMVDLVTKQFGTINVLVNNASIYEKTPFEDATLEDWDSHMDINARAPFLLAQAVAPLMKEAGEGKIINIADWAGHRPYEDWTPYCVSKAALLALNSALARELAPEIQVNAVMPGPVLPPEDATPRYRKNVIAATPLGRFGSPEDVAKAVLFLIESGDFMTGAQIAVDGGRLIS